MNPRLPDCESRQKLTVSARPFGEVDWVSFDVWLQKTHAKNNAKDLWRTAKKYYQILWEPYRAADLYNLSVYSRRLVMAALSNLAKFLGIYGTWKSIVANAGLKWSSGSKDDLIIARLTKPHYPDEMYEWMKQVKEISKDYSGFIDLMAATGLMYVEAISAWNLIVDLTKQGLLNDCYDDSKQVLQHFKFKQVFLRRKKKAFMSFVSADLIKKIMESPRISQSVLVERVRRAGIKRRFSDIREFHGSILTKSLSEPEINFLQGRVSTNVFMRNYFNPAWIGDLQTRTLNAATEILAKLS